MTAAAAGATRRSLVGATGRSPVQAAPKVLATVDGVLADIAHARTVLEMREAVLAKEIEQIKEKYREPIEAAKTELDLLEKELRGLCRRNDAEIFGDQDRVDLESGSLLKNAGRRVVRARGVLAAILAKGWSALIKTPKPAVDWDRVERLSDEAVAALGTERRDFVEYNYELGADR
jgi:phage host-nuclease inhibitor protein Gam